jgi:hypothetical protein
MKKEIFKMKRASHKTKGAFAFLFLYNLAKCFEAFVFFITLGRFTNNAGRNFLILDVEDSDKDLEELESWIEVAKWIYKSK